MNKMKQEIAAYAQGATERLNENTVKKNYCFIEDFIGFSGHFPGYPILPAFVEMLIALILVEELNGGGLKLATVKNAKFYIPVRPNQEIAVECCKKPSGHLGCEVRMKIGEGLAASFLISLTETEDES